MDAQPDEGAMAALFRLIAARAPGAELAVYAVGPRRVRLVATTSPRARLAADPVAADWRALAPRIRPLLAAGGCARIDPAAFGLAPGFGVLCPLRGPGGAPIGFLLVGDVPGRRLGPRLAAALADAARIAAALLAAAGGVATPKRRTAAPPRTSLPPETADGFAARLLAAARQPLAVGGRSMGASASIGVALGAPPKTRPIRLQPEAALRRARRDGRDTGPPASAGGDPATAADGRLQRDLAAAAGRGEMRLVYQGYLDLADGRVSGVEALLRWRHPVRGELAPAEFIPLAETSGLILPLGAWALRAALAAAARWPPRLALSVNVSAVQFHQPGFVAEIDAALAAAGVAPERLELEITETVLMRDTADTTAQLEALIARGVRIALDDFGTGYSALAYLRRLPHHRIKLDRAFVRDLGNPATLELVRAIIALARRTGVAVTAEGVERPDQLSLVRGLGFTHAQGFVTGPPVADPVALLGDPEPAL